MTEPSWNHILMLRCHLALSDNLSSKTSLKHTQVTLTHAKVRCAVCCIKMLLFHAPTLCRSFL